MPDRTTLVVVAIPKQDDHVWDISSEKVPHMTLLFLGDVDWSEAEISRTAGFIEHASSMFTRFGLTVDKRGTLGEDKADVLFFEKGWSFKRVDSFRQTLLANNNIKAAWQKAPQFEEWTPHLTLGFPETPAHEETRDWPIGWVEFDRIALWTGDSDGPTFELPTEQDMALEMSAQDQAAEVVERILSHHGVKGMKWGVRKGRGTPRARTKFSKSPSKLDSAELTKRIARMEAEKKYNSLNQKDKSKGRQITEEILTDSGKRIAKTVATGAGLALVKTLIAAKFGEGPASEVTRRLK